jgi:hypothetical protein
MDEALRIPIGVDVFTPPAFRTDDERRRAREHGLNRDRVVQGATLDSSSNSAHPIESTAAYSGELMLALPQAS